RAAYELFYTPIAAAEKRAAKSIVDVAFDRLGDAVGGGLVRLALLVAPAAQSSVILSLGMAGSAAAIIAASRLNRGYIDSLENNLITRGGAIDVSGMGDGTTRVVMRNIRSAGLSAFAEATADRSGPRSAALKDPPSSGATVKSVSLDPDVQDILSLRSRDRER